MEGPTPRASDPAPDQPPARSGRSRTVRFVLVVLAAVIVLYLLFAVVFPWFQEYQDDPTLEGAASSPVAVAAD
ncbi:MAG TPA: hypothetical protein VGA69_09730 [Nitriliruptorales bacterium]